MHFGKQLKFLAFPPWKHEYIDFAMLKKSLKAMRQAAEAQGRIRVVTREWINEKDGGPVATPSLEEVGAAEHQHPAGEEEPELTLDSTDEKKDSKKKKDEKDKKDKKEKDTSPVPDFAPRRMSMKDFVRKKKNQARASADQKNARKRGAHHEIARLVPEGSGSPDLNSTTTTTTTEEDDNSVELVSVIDMNSGAHSSILGAEEDEHDDDSVEIVVLNDELERIFFDDFWKERDRVQAFFREHADACKSRLTELVNSAKDRRAQDIPLAPMKRDFFELLMECEELIDYARLNLVGFTKILKKFTHNTDFTQHNSIREEIQRADFVRCLPEIEDLCLRVKKQYVLVFGRQGKGEGEDPQALTNELIGSVNAARSWKKNTIILQMDEHLSRATLNLKEKPIGIIPLILAFAVYIFVVFVPMFPAEDLPAQRALAILLAATVMWVAECWPLFMTSTLCIILCLVSYVFVGTDGHIMSPKESVVEIYHALFPSSLPLVIAGFCISEAWSKYGVDVMIAMRVLKMRCFNTPSSFVIAVEIICFFMSAWVSNIAAAVLTLTVISPVIRDLPDGCRYIKTLLMAIALSGNVGGMTTQLASPQNALTVSLGESSVTFIEFILVSCPVCPILLAIGHWLTIAIFPPDVKTLPNLGSEAKAAAIANASSSGYASVALDTARNKFRTENSIKIASDRTLKLYQNLTIILTIVSIGLWVASNFMPFFGQDIGMISVVPIALFCGTGLVNKADFERLPWALVALIAGGNVLGKAIESSKLLDIIAGLVGALPPSLFLIMIVTSVITMIISCFVSHTIASIILLPLAAKIGSPLGHPRLMVMVTNTVCTASIAVPVSSFPNLTATSVEDSRGKPYLSTMDFLKIGIPVTLISLVGICSVTYGMSLLFGF